MKGAFYKTALFISLFCVLLFVSSRDKENYATGSYRSTLFVDPAGYNVYLPATFQYSFINNFPNRTDSVVAYGFMLNSEKRVITKFTYGVALLQLPFYVGGLIICKALDIPNTGYSPVNHLIVDLSGIFYVCLGLFILFNLLRRFFSPLISFYTVSIVFLGTNLFYYATIQPGMSHAYSFFLVVVSTHLLLSYLDSKKFKHFFFFSVSIALIVLIRPINVIALIPIACIGIQTKKELISRFKLILTAKNIFSFLVLAFLVFLPQLIYWKFAYGHYIADSYPGESFSFLKHPKIIELLLSPHNGLIAYSPLYLLLFALSVYYIRKDPISGLTITISILCLAYLSASWYLYFFGCGFGARNFVEYTGLLAIPFAHFLQSNSKRIISGLVIVLAVVFSLYNLRLLHSWEICFWGKNDWDWKEYKYLLIQPHKQLTLDLDSLDQNKIKLLQNDKVYKIDSLELYSPGINFFQSTYSSSYFKSAEINIDVMPLLERSSAQLACMASLGDSTVFYTAIILNGEKGVWKSIQITNALPFDSEKDYQIKIFIMNNQKEKYYFKNFKVKLH